jgi:16S rRNA processing protein RimM
MIAVGKIIKSIGIRGEVKLYILSDSLNRFKKLKKVYIGENETITSEYYVENVREVAESIRIKFRGIENRDNADKLRNQFIFVSEEETIRLKKGKYFDYEIEGLEAFTEQGERIGIIQQVMHLPVHDVWVVRGKHNEVLIPAVREFIKGVDLNKGSVIIRTIEGLLNQ